MNSTTELLFSGKPIPQDKPCGWQERQDALHQRPGKPMPPPWNWEIHDHSMATLCGGGEDGIIAHIMSVSPCDACAKRADPKEWKWGRCCTPTEENARLIAAASDLLEALVAVVAIADRKTDEFDRAKAAIAKAIGANTE